MLLLFYNSLTSQLSSSLVFLLFPPPTLFSGLPTVLFYESRVALCFKFIPHDAVFFSFFFFLANAILTEMQQKKNIEMHLFYSILTMV